MTCHVCSGKIAEAQDYCHILNDAGRSVPMHAKVSDCTGQSLQAQLTQAQADRGECHKVLLAIGDYWNVANRKLSPYSLLLDDERTISQHVTDLLARLGDK